jgi:5-methyltetrahydrofolate--homocysteine methyltransferase
MIVIGEKINGTRKRVAKAIQERDSDYIKDLAIRQVKSGANYLDVNAGTTPDREIEDLKWIVKIIQDSTDSPLCLDSANPEALAAAIKGVNKTPIINSVSGEVAKLDGVLPLACENNTGLIVLALDDDGIPETVDQRLEIISKIVKLTRKGGLSDGNLYIDPLIISLGTNQDSGLNAFAAIRSIKTQFPEAHVTSGLSNISFGLPARKMINQAFFVLAIEAGLDSAIMDPTDKTLYSLAFATDALLGKDDYCVNYTGAYRKGLIPGKLEK